jgi:hypothetical protein
MVRTMTHEEFREIVGPMIVDALKKLLSPSKEEKEALHKRVQEMDFDESEYTWEIVSK